MPHARSREFFSGGGGLKDIYVLRGGGGVQGLFMVFLICGFNKFEFSRVGGGDYHPLSRSVHAHLSILVY